MARRVRRATQPFAGEEIASFAVRAADLLQPELAAFVEVSVGLLLLEHALGTRDVLHREHDRLGLGGGRRGGLIVRFHNRLCRE